MSDDLKQIFNAGNFDLYKFFDKYGVNDKSCLTELKKVFPLGSEISSNLTRVHLDITDFNKGRAGAIKRCEDYLLSVALLAGAEKEVALEPEKFREMDSIFDEEDLIEHKEVIETPWLPSNYWVKNIVCVLCLDESVPQSEEIADRRRDDFILPEITYGMILDYRENKNAPQPEKDTSLEDKQSYQKTLQALNGFERTKKPLKRF